MKIINFNTKKYLFLLVTIIFILLTLSLVVAKDVVRGSPSAAITTTPIDLGEVSFSCSSSSKCLEIDEVWLRFADSSGSSHLDEVWYPQQQEWLFYDPDPTGAIETTGTIDLESINNLRTASPDGIRTFVRENFGSDYVEDVDYLTRILAQERSCGTGWNKERGAIAQVVINRVHSSEYGNTIKDVVASDGWNANFATTIPATPGMDASSRRGCVLSALRFLACVGEEHQGALEIGARIHFAHRCSLNPRTSTRPQCDGRKQPLQLDNGNWVCVPNWNLDGYDPVQVQSDISSSPGQCAAHFSDGTSSRDCSSRHYRGEPNYLSFSSSSGTSSGSLTVREGERLRFVVASDLNPSYGDHEYSRSVPNAARAIDSINPDLVVLNGDMIASGNPSSSDPGTLDEMWNGFESSFVDHISTNIYPSPGNHDIGSSGNRQNMETAYQQFWTEHSPFDYSINNYPFYYSFDIEKGRNDYHFIILDGSDNVNSEMLEWFRDDFNRNLNADYFFIFSHVPLYPLSNADSHPETSIGSSREIMQIIDGYTDNLYWFNAHQHVYFKGVKNNLNNIFVGAVVEARALPAGAQNQQENSFIVVDVAGEDIHVYAYEGNSYTSRMDEYFMPNVNADGYSYLNLPNTPIEETFT
ncbi:MAG: metallophosphoesterase [Nanoarchaeota archaeon]|nr:metallophosphoesterase [Nanoarchaeota archaeon]MBU1622526.1 metallophosphoesterase [Nanoarchaeota archaeon]MBU1973845.1 metallophosphoesterase [Nanoarchaeota archaeon]